MSDLWEHLLPVPSGPKEHRFHRVGWAIAVTLLRAGPEALRVSDVARRAGVSRPWIYKYLGGDPAGLLTFAVGLFGRAFAAPGVDASCSDSVSWREAVAEGTRKGLSDVLVAPWCVLVFMRYRHATGVLGEAIRAVEREEIERFVGRMPSSLRGDPVAAARFATLFAVARLGVYHHWLDPQVRSTVGEDAVVGGLLHLVDGYLLSPYAWSAGARGPHPREAEG